ncbi:MAG: thiamine pyrophosphate-binding protein [Betaproteobacteria bacterium]|nr:thiamine pyrophosphate-binding protein [Betaproteobacteria bacterium]
MTGRTRMRNKTSLRTSTRRRKKVVPTKIRWCSDIIVDLMRQYDFPYVPLNPGSSYRGLHDSMVNYGQDDPQMLMCPHENIAIQIAHGYAKATGEPLVAIVHNLVGLLHACMAVYYAYIDRVPIFLIGATGPLDTAQRRPRTDWIHTAKVQGNAVRDYTKWDDQPHTIDDVPDSFARAYSAMMTEPQGPVYTCYDATMLEQALPHAVAMPPLASARVPSRMAPDPAELARIAEMLVAARQPILLADWTCRAPHGFAELVALAEMLGAGVVDIGARLNFPNRHPLNMSLCAEAALKDADLIVALDARDWEKVTTRQDSATGKRVSLVPKTARWVEISFADVEISSWSTDYQRRLHSEIKVLADTSLAIPELSRQCRRLLARSAGAGARIEGRKRKLERLHRRIMRTWARRAKENWDSRPITTARLASEIWNVIKDEDWVLASSNLNGWCNRLWDYDQPYRYSGNALGTSTQIGTALGAALAHRNKNRLVVDIQPDGDLMFDPGALWVAAKYSIPMLVVMYNNRAYYNDWEHQIRIARRRGTPVERAYIGMDIVDPEVDFAGLARSMGWHAENRIETGDDVAAALRRAIAAVKSGRPALVDTLTQFR